MVKMNTSVETGELLYCFNADKVQSTLQMAIKKTEETNEENIHLKDLTLNQFICEVCGKEFQSNSEYKTHKNHFVANHKYFLCCNKVEEFENKHICKRTLLKSQTLENNQICPIKEEIERKNDFIWNKLDDNGSSDEINNKDKVFNGNIKKNKKYKKKLILHEEMKYKIYKCQVCLQLFAKYINLCQHSKIIHNKHGKFKCSICDEDCNTNEDFKSHMDMHGPEDKIVCKGCKRTFDSLKLYYSHAKQNPGMHCYTCKLCLRKFPTELLLDQHVCIWQNGKPLHCACGREFTTYEDVITHSKGTKPFSCCSCPHLANSLTAYIRHLRKHSKQKPYHCVQCDMKFAVIEFLNIHNKKFHNGNENEFPKEHNSDTNQLTQHTCSLCNHKFNTAEELKKHSVKVHEEKSAFENERIQCPDCGKFLKRYRLEHHRNITHKTSARLCSECGKLFDTRFKLTQHILTAHNSEPVKCEVCMKVLKTKKILNEHMKTHLKSELGGRIPQAICPMCGLGLAQKGSLARHILLTHERHKIIPCHKTYTCQECSAVLPNRAKYYSHRRMHRAMVDRYPCEVCGREFNKKQNLKRHMYLLHDETRVIPDPIFKCQFCKRSFREKKNRKRHYQMVHKVDDIV